MASRVLSTIRSSVPCRMSDFDSPMALLWDVKRTTAYSSLRPTGTEGSVVPRFHGSMVPRLSSPFPVSSSRLRGFMAQLLLHLFGVPKLEGAMAKCDVCGKHYD